MALPKFKITKMVIFLFCLDPGFEPGCARVATARYVPFENEVFVGDSPQDTHGEYADEQLTTI